MNHFAALAFVDTNAEHRGQAAEIPGIAVCSWYSCAWVMQVSRVLYPGLPEHPYFPRVQKLFGGQAGGVVTFELLGGAAAAELMFQVCCASSITEHQSPPDACGKC